MGYSLGRPNACPLALRQGGAKLVWLSRPQAELASVSRACPSPNTKIQHRLYCAKRSQNKKSAASCVCAHTHFSSFSSFFTFFSFLYWWDFVGNALGIPWDFLGKCNVERCRKCRSFVINYHAGCWEFPRRFQRHKTCPLCIGRRGRSDHRTVSIESRKWFGFSTATGAAPSRYSTERI